MLLQSDLRFEREGIIRTVAQLSRLRTIDGCNVQKRANPRAIIFWIANDKLCLQKQCHFGMPDLKRVAIGHANRECLKRPAIQ
jgi:hypothetical protein